MPYIYCAHEAWSLQNDMTLIPMQSIWNGKMKIDSSYTRIVAYGKDLPTVESFKDPERQAGLDWFRATSAAEPIQKAAQQRAALERQLASCAWRSDHADTLERDAKALLANKGASSEEKEVAAQWQNAARSMRAEIKKEDVGHMSRQRDALNAHIESFRGTAAMDFFNRLFDQNGHFKDNTFTV